MKIAALAVALVLSAPLYPKAKIVLRTRCCWSEYGVSIEGRNALIRVGDHSNPDSISVRWVNP